MKAKANTTVRPNNTILLRFLRIYMDGGITMKFNFGKDKPSHLPDSHATSACLPTTLESQKHQKLILVYCNEYSE